MSAIVNSIMLSIKAADVLKLQKSIVHLRYKTAYKEIKVTQTLQIDRADGTGINYSSRCKH